MQNLSSRSIFQVLHLEDSVVDHQLVKLALAKTSLHCELKRVENLADFIRCVREQQLDLILADYRLPGFTALDAWAHIKDLKRPPPFVLVSGAIGEAAAVSAINLGLSDYVLKDDLSRLEHVIRRALEVRETRIAKDKAYADLVVSEQRLAEFSEHLQTTIEKERASIAREIHDDIGGALASVKLDLSWIARRTTDAAMQTHVRAATDMITHALDASQRIMMNLRPAILDQGLLPAIGWLAAGFERRSGIKTTLNAPSFLDGLTKDVQLAAYRTAQEALTNALKHANCNVVAIDLSDLNGVLTLEITDNGTGFDCEAETDSNAFGIKGLNERAKLVGGWLDVISRKGAGTSIILSIPVTATNSLFHEETDK